MSDAAREPFSLELLDALSRRQGMSFSAEHLAELHVANVALSRVLTRLDTTLPRETEPAHVFAPSRFDVMAGERQ